MRWLLFAGSDYTDAHQGLVLLCIAVLVCVADWIGSTL